MPIRCINTTEDLTASDADLAQEAQRQTESEATHAHVARMCLAHLDAALQHCDAARNGSLPMLTCTNTTRVVRSALTARDVTHALAKRTRDSGAPSPLTIPPPPSQSQPVHVRSWYNSVLGLKPGWLMTLHHAQHADDDTAREKQEAEITKLNFSSRQDAHVRLCGSVLSISPTRVQTKNHTRPTWQTPCAKRERHYKKHVYKFAPSSAVGRRTQMSPPFPIPTDSRVGLRCLL